MRDFCVKQMNKIKITFNSPVILGFVFASFVVLILGCLTEGAAKFLRFSSGYLKILIRSGLYSHLQACGIINDHDETCTCYAKINNMHPTVNKRKDKEVY